MSQRRRVSKGILVASTNEVKQSIIKSQLIAFQELYRKEKVLIPLLLIFMQIEILSH